MILSFMSHKKKEKRKKKRAIILHAGGSNLTTRWILAAYQQPMNLMENNNE